MILLCEYYASIAEEGSEDENMWTIGEPYRR